MNFIGQSHITKQLEFILPDLRENKTKGCAMLFRGPSGYGKTRMANMVCLEISGRNYQVFLGENRPFRFTKRVVFIDEIHTVVNLERFYKVMDDAIHVLVFATNHDSNLPEAFTNRCYQFILTDYSREELILISRTHCGFYATDEQHISIINASNQNPRIIRSLCKRLGIFFQRNPGKYSPYTDFSELISDIFQIKDGLDTTCKRYLDVLKELGGTARLGLIVGLLHVDERTIRNDIEPILMKKGLIKISSKGRILC